MVIEDVLGNLPAADKDRAERIAERIAEFYESPLAGTVRIRLRYFVDQAEFEQAIRAAYGRLVPVGGFYVHGKEIVVGPGSRYFLGVVHETSHFIADQTFTDLPNWLDEGLAGFFCRASPDPAGLRVMLPREELAQLSLWKASGRKPGLKTLLQMTREQVFQQDLEHNPMVRALSWSIVDFLTSTDEGMQLLRRFVRELHEQDEKRDPYDAMVTAYDGGFPGLEAAWLRHIDKRLAE